MLKKNPLPPFVAVKSKENIVLSIIISACVFFIIAVCLLLLLGAVYILFVEEDEPIFLKVIILLIGLVMNGIWIYLWKRSALTRYTDVTINEKGIFYDNRYTGKPVRQVKWTDFRSRDNYAIDCIEPSKGLPLLGWWEAGEPLLRRHEGFRMSHFYPGAFRNRGELIATLLLGFAHFRPDLTIDPKIYSSFHIDEQKYVFKRKQKIIESLFILLFFIIICLLIYLWV